MRKIGLVSTFGVEKDFDYEDIKSKVPIDEKAEYIIYRQFDCVSRFFIDLCKENNLKYSLKESKKYGIEKAREFAEEIDLLVAGYTTTDVETKGVIALTFLENKPINLFKFKNGHF